MEQHTSNGTTNQDRRGMEFIAASAPPLQYPALDILYTTNAVLNTSPMYPELHDPTPTPIPLSYNTPPTQSVLLEEKQEHFGSTTLSPIVQQKGRKEAEAEEDVYSFGGENPLEVLEVFDDMTNNAYNNNDVQFYMFQKLGVLKRERLIGLLTIEIILCVVISLVVMCIAMASPIEAARRGDIDVHMYAALKFTTSTCVIEVVLCLAEALLAFLCITRIQAGIPSFQTFMAIKLLIMITSFIVTLSGGLSAMFSGRGGGDEYRTVGRFMDVSGTVLLIVMPIIILFLFSYQGMIITNGNIIEQILVKHKRADATLEREEVEEEEETTHL